MQPVKMTWADPEIVKGASSWSLGMKVPVEVQGQSPGRRSGDSPQKLVIFSKLGLYYNHVIWKKNKTVVVILYLAVLEVLDSDSRRRCSVRPTQTNLLDPPLSSAMRMVCRGGRLIVLDDGAICRLPSTKYNCTFAVVTSYRGRSRLTPPSTG